MIKTPPFLKSGDLVGIVPPAYRMDAIYFEEAKDLLESWGLKVLFSSNYTNSYFEFAGNDNERLQGLQELLDHNEVRCIFCARGGYGTSRIIDHIKLEKFIKSPKWVIGFSDITILLNRLLRENIASIHGPMPVNFGEEGADEPLWILRQFLFDGIYPEINFKTEQENRAGNTDGPLIGGNLSLVTHSIGTHTEINTEGKILFIEDIDEKLYKIDRMIVHLHRANVFNGLKGLIVGHFSKIQDQKKFGQSINEIILHHTSQYDFPVCFQAPIGHIMPNHPLIIGKSINLRVEKQSASFSLK